MEVIPFIASSPADAVHQIRARLGPAAVVLHVRQMPQAGWGRFWRKPALEVLAYVPDAPAGDPDGRATPPAEADGLTAAAPFPAPPGPQPFKLSRPLSGPFPGAWGPAAEDSDTALRGNWPESRSTASGSPTSTPARCADLLTSLGLLPLYVERVLEGMGALRDDPSRGSLADEFLVARKILHTAWRPPPADEECTTLGPHVFVGPPGSGKTTVLCKWLTETVLSKGGRARIWRLDGPTANLAESLNVYGEILGVPVERQWRAQRLAAGSEVAFVDLPGVDFQDAAGLRQLQDTLGALSAPHLHLVLNAAYTTPLLLRQVRAFSLLPLGDLVFTHLDEERNWGKLWNFVLGTNFSIRFLSAGQNIPGYFCAARAERLWPAQFSQENEVSSPVSRLG